MGLFDKLKGALNAVTGGAADVTIDYPRQAFLGDTIAVKITARSTGAAVESKGVFVDLRGEEQIEGDVTINNQRQHFNERLQTLEQTFRIAEAFTLAASEHKTWEGTVTLPQDGQPTYEGVRARHHWTIRGRIEAFGNDPSSSYQDLRICKKY